MKLRGSSRATSCSLRALVYHNIPTNTLAQCSQLGAVNNPQRSKPKNTAKSCSSLPEPSVKHRFPSCTYQLKGPKPYPNQNFYTRADHHRYSTPDEQLLKSTTLPIASTSRAQAEDCPWQGRMESLHMLLPWILTHSSEKILLEPISCKLSMLCILGSPG